MALHLHLIDRKNLLRASILLPLFLGLYLKIWQFPVFENEAFVHLSISVHCHSSHQQLRKRARCEHALEMVQSIRIQSL